MEQFHIQLQSQNSSPRLFNPQGVPYWLDFYGKVKNGLVEYFEIMKTQISFGKLTLILQGKHK